jgi:uncharacterized Zn-binding protein involved in type VI secretion
MSNGTLARQAAGGVHSTTRDSQAKTQFEDTWQSVHGAGVVSGGAVTKTSGYSLQLASGTVLEQEGVLYTLSSVASYTVPATANTHYLYVKVVRTSAGIGNPQNEDTYALGFTTNTTGSTPAGYFPLAIVRTDGSGIVDITDPDGKYLRATSPIWQGKDTIAAGEGAVIAAGEQVTRWGTMTVRGRLTVRGLLKVGGL